MAAAAAVTLHGAAGMVVEALVRLSLFQHFLTLCLWQYQPRLRKLLKLPSHFAEQNHE
jgi:hypothetical protein